MRNDLLLSQDGHEDRLERLFGKGAAQVLARSILERHLLFHLPESASPICFLELPVSDNQRVRTSGFWILEQTPGGDFLTSDLSRFRESKLISPREEKRLWALASMCLAETLTGQQDIVGIFSEDSSFGRYVVPTLLANVEVREINLFSQADILDFLTRGGKRVNMIAEIGGGTNLMARSTVSRLEAFWRCTHDHIGLNEVLGELEGACEHDSLKDMIFRIDQIERQAFPLEEAR